MVPCHSYNRVVLPAAVILDFDGVILDSETPEFESHRRVFEQCGATLTDEEWCVQIGTWSEGLGDRWHAALCERSSQPLDRQTFERERRRIFEEIVPREPMRGIRELLQEKPHIVEDQKKAQRDLLSLGQGTFGAQARSAL